MPTSHRLSPIVGSFATAMKPLWPSMLMSSTLVRDSSSVLRSRPIGLPRYQVNEKCGPDDAAVLQPLATYGVARGVDEAGRACVSWLTV